MSEHPNCPTCTCGLLYAEWSDRHCYYDPTDAKDIVETILSCCLDHHYDRTETGVPYGMEGKIENTLASVIQAWFRENHPEWFKESVFLEDYEKESLRENLLTALEVKL